MEQLIYGCWLEDQCRELLTLVEQSEEQLFGGNVGFPLVLMFRHKPQHMIQNGSIVAITSSYSVRTKLLP